MYGDKNKLILSDKARQSLLETTKWVKYFIIVTCVGLVTNLIFKLIPNGDAMSATLGKYLNRTATTNPYMSIAGAIIYAVIIIYPLYALNEFARFIKSGNETNKPQDYETAFSFHRQTFLYLGIATIIAISLMILVLIGSIIFVAASAAAYN